MLYSDVLEVLNSDEHLEHFGIKGMRWGHRRTLNSNTNTSTKQRPPMSNQTKKKIATAVGATLLGGLMAYAGVKHVKEVKQEKELFERSQRLLDDIFGKNGTLSLVDINTSRKEFGLPSLF